MVFFISKLEIETLDVPYSQIVNWGIENWNIWCSLWENIGDRFPDSEMSEIGNRNMEMFIFE